jgi:nucleoside 2-deoxyribosyltransferase
MSKQVVYYAHSVHLYNTDQEKRDICLLENLGFEVYNPNQPHIQKMCEDLKAQGLGADIMKWFEELIDNCDVLAFRAHIDGKIPSGVGYEIKYAQSKGKEVFEIPTLLKSRFLDYEDTKEYLKLFGNR